MSPPPAPRRRNNPVEDPVADNVEVPVADNVDVPVVNNVAPEPHRFQMTQTDLDVFVQPTVQALANANAALTTAYARIQQMTVDYAREMANLRSERDMYKSSAELRALVNQAAGTR